MNDNKAELVERLRTKDKKIYYSLHTIHFFYVQKCEIKATVDYVNTYIVWPRKKKRRKILCDDSMHHRNI